MNLKEKVFKIKFFILSLALFTANSLLLAQANTDPFPKIEEEIKIKEPVVKPKDPFLLLLAKKLSTSQSWLQKNFARGVGRSELVRLVLISKKSGKSLEEITQEYDKGISIKKIALAHQLDYSSLKKEAAALLKETEEEFKKKSKETPPTAGISEQNNH